MLALAALLTVAPLPALADALIDNVDGITLDKDGRVVRFTGLLMTLDGHVTRLLRRRTSAPTSSTGART